MPVSLRALGLAGHTRLPSMLMLAVLALAATAREVRLVMGAPAEVRVAAQAPEQAIDAAFAALDLVDGKMSLWKKESELSALNRSGGGPVSAELRAVVARALDVARDSEGAFDPTVRPLARGGWARVRLLGDVVRLEPGTALDLGGIAKGYAVDLALQALRDSGASSGLVSLGQSSIGVFGEPLALDLRDPERPEGSPWGSLVLADGHASTSAADQRAGHILDPHSGRPAAGALAVTVIAASGIEADALSTAVFVLGARAGLDLLRRRGAEGVVLSREAGGLVARTSAGFAARHRLRLRPGVRLRGSDAGGREPGVR